MASRIRRYARPSVVLESRDVADVERIAAIVTDLPDIIIINIIIINIIII